MSKIETIVVPVDTRQLEKAIKLTKELIALGKESRALMNQPSIKPKGRTL